MLKFIKTEYFTKTGKRKRRAGTFIPVIFLFLAVIFLAGTGPVSADPGIIYVNNATGDDTWDGQSPVYDSTTKSGPKLSIKNAVGTVNNGGTIHIAEGVYNGADNRNITIDRNMSIIGQSQSGTVIDAQGSDRIFTVQSGVNLTLQNLTIENGYTDNGAVYNPGGTLIVKGSTFTGNKATNHGGAIYSDGSGTLTVIGSTFTGNKATNYGGAIYNEGMGSFTVSNSTFTGNTAENGGAINNYVVNNFNVIGSNFTGNNATGNGGAISNFVTSFNVINSTFTGNIGGSSGGAISGGGDHSTITINNSVFTANSVWGSGGAVYKNRGNVVVIGSNFTGNNAGGCGAVIYVYAASVNLSFNRIVGNALSGGYPVYCGSGSIVATNNWWGSNEPDLHSLTYGTVGIDPWIVLTVTPDPASIESSGIVQVKTDLNHDSKGQDISSQGHVPDGIPVTFTAANGTINTASSTLVNGAAVSTFTAGNSGMCGFTATLDNCPVSININRAPILSLIGNKTVDENKPLSFTLGGSDRDGDTLTYIATGLPAGATLDQDTGLFSWTPTFNQAGTYQITFKVFDCCSTTTENITIKVNDVDNIAATANVKTGTYNTDKVVKLTMNENGDIYYTINGSDPTTASTRYTKALTINKNATLKFMAVDSVGNKSPVYTAKYSINKPPAVTAVYPKKSSTGISRSNTIYLKFSKNIKTSINWSKVYIKNLKTGKKVAVSKVIKNKVLYLKTGKRSANTWYQIYIPASAIKDAAGNNAAGYTWKFKTGKR